MTGGISALGLSIYKAGNPSGEEGYRFGENLPSVYSVELSTKWIMHGGHQVIIVEKWRKRWSCKDGRDSLVRN